MKKTLKEIFIKYSVLIAVVVTLLVFALYCINKFYKKVKQDISNEIDQITQDIDDFVDDTQQFSQSLSWGAATSTPSLNWLIWWL